MERVSTHLAPDERRPGASDKVLLGQLRSGFPLADRPFAEVGRRVGWPEEEVIERLRELLASGALARFGPVYAREYGKPAPVRRSAVQLLERQLIAATRAGLPLVPQPYEALGAMLGVSAAEVKVRLAALLARGVIRRIGAVASRPR
jgi:DNA-binding Lrp family transcriptional regulator